jgi:hypothetical protein
MNTLALMSRPLRIEYPGAYYHAEPWLVTQKYFLEDKDRERFLELLGKTSRQLLNISLDVLPCLQDRRSAAVEESIV